MKYVIYCRRSTDTEDRQILSLDSQESELRQLAESHGLEVSAVMRESKSAKVEGRPIFNEVLEVIRKGKADGIICWKLDRLARNFIDGGRIIDQLQRGKIKEIRTHESIHLPTDNVMLLAVQLGMANQYIRDLSQNVKRGNRAKLERGDWPAPAPYGYVNDRLNKTILVDEKYARYIRRAFELYATGTYSLSQVRDKLYGEGMRTKFGGKIVKSKMHHFLNNKFYTGLMEREGKVYKGNHVPIVSSLIYEQVQDVLHGRNHPKHEKKFYAARGFLNCAVCGCMLTADTKKGHQYYYCTNGKGDCGEHKSYLRGELVDELLAGIFAELRFDEELVRIAGEAYQEARKWTSHYHSNSLHTLQEQLKTLDDKESMLTDAYSSRTLRKELYEAKMLEVSNRRVELQEQISQSGGLKPYATFEQVEKVFLDSNRAANKFLTSTQEQKREILGIVLSNAKVSNRNIAQFQFKTPFDILAKVPKNATTNTLLPG